MRPSSLATIRREVLSCERCQRLRTYCARVAEEKRASFRHERYWGRPLPGFGDPNARILILGLAPAAHGANRTGRMFTGDRSEDFLVEALHGAGLANQPVSNHLRDGLRLSGAFITAVARCAPPQNKPTPEEIANCAPYLRAEVQTLKQVRVVVALGKIAFDTYWRQIADPRNRPRPRPRFRHGLVYESVTAPTLVASYHPSQQNTNTGKLTRPMLAAVFAHARDHANRNPANRLGARPRNPHNPHAR